MLSSQKATPRSDCYSAKLSLLYSTGRSTRWYWGLGVFEKIGIIGMFFFTGSKSGDMFCSTFCCWSMAWLFLCFRVVLAGRNIGTRGHEFSVALEWNAIYFAFRLCSQSMGDHSFFGALQGFLCFFLRYPHEHMAFVVRSSVPSVHTVEQGIFILAISNNINSLTPHIPLNMT